jgi:putative transposase
MDYNPNLHKRRSIRLKGYDYSQTGLYFITLCVQNRENLFGQIKWLPDNLDAENETDRNFAMRDRAPTRENETTLDFEMRDRAPTRDAPTMVLNDAGKMVENEWLALPVKFPQIVLHEYVVMPNHFHGIIEITKNVGAPLVGALSPADPTPPKYQPDQMYQNVKGKSIGEIIGAFKSLTTNAYIRGVKTMNWQPFKINLWQRNFWEHIIRDERAYFNISEYIVTNPRNWDTDKLK